MPDHLAAEGLQRRPAGVGGEMLLGRNRPRSPDPPRNLAASTGPTANGSTSELMDLATVALMRLTAAMRCSRSRTAAIISPASCRRVAAGAPAGVTAAGSTTARLAVRLCRASSGIGW
jgi:hypothetical protein